MNTPRMLQQLELHEGVKLHVYVDTEGNDTLGIGYNATARTFDDFERTIGRKIDTHAIDCITEAEARQQCLSDIKRVERAVIVHFPVYQQLDDVRQRVVLDLAFNIGFRAQGFKKCAAAIERKDWSTAAIELHKAHWARQVQPNADVNATVAEIHNEKVRGRADRLARMLLTGEDFVS